VESLVILSSHIYLWVRRWKKVENRSTFDKVMGKSRVSCFFWLTRYNFQNICRYETEM